MFINDCARKVKSQNKIITERQYFFCEMKKNMGSINTYLRA